MMASRVSMMDYSSGLSIFGFDEVELAVFFLVFVAEFGLFVGEVD